MAETQTKLAVLISGNGSNLQAIIDQIESGRLNAEVVCVISNQALAYGLERAEKHNIPNYCIQHERFETKPEFEAEILNILSRYRPDLIILAGFMRILSAQFIAHYPQRILNIHPSLLPRFKGLDTHRRALASGDRIHGASVHLVTEELDSGKIIMQDCCRVEDDDDVKSLQKKVHQIEHKLYALAISKYSQRLTP